MANKVLKKVINDIENIPIENLRNLVEKSLEESDLLKTILDNISEGHLILDNNYSIKIANKTLSSLIPIKRGLKNLEGKKALSVINDEDIKKFLDSVFIGNERAEDRDFSFDRSGEVRTIRVSFKTLTLNDLTYLDIVFQDITNSLRSEARLRRSESLASMTTMAAGIAHEIKNPLAAMKLHIQLMQKALEKKGTLSKEEAKKYLDVIDEETDRLNSITVNFLYAVRPMNTELKLTRINSILEELISFISLELEENEIELSVNLSPYLPMVKADPKYIRQAVLNLIQNSIYALNNTKNKKLISIKTQLEGNFIAIYISDTGEGIREDKIQKIFEPYYSTKLNGTGLGLTTVFKIMKEHGGEIHVRSQIGQGTIFKLEFPVPSSERATIGVKDE